MHTLQERPNRHIYTSGHVHMQMTARAQAEATEKVPRATHNWQLTADSWHLTADSWLQVLTNSEQRNENRDKHDRYTRATARIFMHMCSIPVSVLVCVCHLP